MNLVLLLIMFLTSPSLLSAKWKGKHFPIKTVVETVDECPSSCNILELANQATNLTNRLREVTAEFNSLTSKEVISCDATHEASSLTSTSCKNSFDGSTGTSWKTADHGTWIQLFLEKPTRLTSLVLTQHASLERIMHIRVEFSDNSNQTAMLPSGDYGIIRDTISLVPVETSWVKITVRSLYSGDAAYFAEIACY